MSHGTFFAIAFSTAPDVSRVALPSGPPGTRGCRRPSPPAAPPLHAQQLSRRARGARPSSARRLIHASRSLRPRAPSSSAKCSYTSSAGTAHLRPAVEPLGGAHLVLAKRLAVCFRCPACAGAPYAMELSTMISVGRCCSLRNRRVGARQHGEVVGVADTGDVPAQADEPGGDILGKGQRRAPFDGDRVVVVDPAQVRQVQVPGERCRFRRRPPSCRRRRTVRRRRSQTSRSPGG